MWKSGHRRMCGNPYARVTILASHSVASIPAVDEKIDVAMTVTDAAIQKYIEFATPNAESEKLDQKQLFIQKCKKSVFWPHGPQMVENAEFGEEQKRPGGDWMPIWNEIKLHTPTPACE